MPPSDPVTITHLVTDGPARSEVGHKQLTLALGGLYIASTTASAKPLLVWEAEKGYARYYIPTESLHDDIKQHLAGSESDRGDSEQSIEVVKVDSVTGEDNKSHAVIERLTVGSKSTTWARFVEGPLKGFIRFERSEIGWSRFISIFRFRFFQKTI